MDILTNSSRFYDRDFSVVLTTIWLLTTVLSKQLWANPPSPLGAWPATRLRTEAITFCQNVIVQQALGCSKD